MKFLNKTIQGNRKLFKNMIINKAHKSLVYSTKIIN